MNNTEFNQGLMTFIQASPTPFHAVKNMAELLEAEGFVCLQEADVWQLKAGKKILCHPQCLLHYCFCLRQECFE